MQILFCFRYIVCSLFYACVSTSIVCLFIRIDWLICIWRRSATLWRHTHTRVQRRAHAPYPEQNVCVFTLDKAHFVYTKCWAIAINPRLLLEDVADGSGASNAEGRKSHVLTFFSSCTQFVRKFYFGVWIRSMWVTAINQTTVDLNPSMWLWSREWANVRKLANSIIKLSKLCINSNNSISWSVFVWFRVI